MSYGRRSLSPLQSNRARWLRSSGVWVGFAVATVATFFGVARLHHTVQRELQEQGDRALQQERSRVEGQLHQASHELRHSIIAALASFHVEGLGHALQQWDEATLSVTGTFQWQPGRELLPRPALPSGLRSEELVELWTAFRGWRKANPSPVGAELGSVGQFRTVHVPLLGNANFSPRDLGYQAENLEILSYAGRPVDPWAGWAVATQAAERWIFWYQLGPDAPVRGAWVDVTALITQFRREWADGRLARVDLVAAGSTRSESEQAPSLEALPGFSLVVQPGEVFTDKQSSARLLTAIVIVLLALFLVGAALLLWLSRVEVRDAERKNTFVTQVSHELRTPLTSIRMFAEMLGADDLAADKRARYATMITRESQRLSHLIERLLTFSALERGERSGHLAAIDAAALTRETVEEMESIAHAAGMTIEADLPGHVVRVQSDRAALKQALLNLLDNAIKYARDGKVVRVTLTADAHVARLHVCDQGPGIPATLGERAFDPFVQGTRSLTDKSPGIGLGLSIARGLLREARGELALLPSARGACFEIRLPLADP